MDIQISVAVDGCRTVRPIKFLGSSFNVFRLLMKEVGAQYDPIKRLNIIKDEMMEEIKQKLEATGFTVEVYEPKPTRGPKNDEERDAVAGLIYVAAQDPDRASEHNKVGFSGMDTEFGHKMAELCKKGQATDKQWVYIMKLAHKYRKQIKQGLVDRIKRGM